MRGRTGGRAAEKCAGSRTRPFSPQELVVQQSRSSDFGRSTLHSGQHTAHGAKADFGSTRSSPGGRCLCPRNARGAGAGAGAGIEAGSGPASEDGGPGKGGLAAATQGRKGHPRGAALRPYPRDPGVLWVCHGGMGRERRVPGGDRGYVSAPPAFLPSTDVEGPSPLPAPCPMRCLFSSAAVSSAPPTSHRFSSPISPSFPTVQGSEGQ